MTEQEIRAMDGEQLTQAAWALGLAPHGVRRSRVAATFFDEDERAWKPHERIAQADAVLRGLRTRGWIYSQSWVPQRPAQRRGYIEAVKGLRHLGEHYTDTTDEPLALLRVSVRAVASEQKPQKEPTP